MSKKKYIVATCKSWHEKGYEELKNQISADWFWAASPDDLLVLLKNVVPRYIFFLHWNWLVPPDVWSKYECVCFHMTDVPYGRGGSPLQNLIVTGHKETKLSVLQMVGEMDAGPVYIKKVLLLDGRAEEIYKRAGELSFEIIRWMVETEPNPELQQGDVVIFKRRNPMQSKLPVSGALEGIYDHIRMLDAPTYPFAFIEHGCFRLEFSNAELKKDKITAQVTIRQVKPERAEK